MSRILCMGGATFFEATVHGLNVLSPDKYISIVLLV